MRVRSSLAVILLRLADRLALRAGVGILLPLAAVVCYITRQAQYTSSNILQRTLYTFFHLTEQKNSLTTRCARAAASATRPLRLTPRGWAPGARVAKWRRS